MSTKPNLHWRSVLRSAMPRAPTDEGAFLAFCTTTFADEKRRLDDVLARGGAERELGGARLGVYVIALALLTYGHLDVIGDVLENMPPPSHPANRGLAPLVERLLPLPGGLHAGTAPADVLAWIRANESALRWDEPAGQFMFVSS